MASSGHERGRALTLTAAAVVVMSVGFTMIKVVLRSMTPLGLATGRVVLSAAACGVVVVAQPTRRTPIERRDRWRLLFCGFGGSAGFHLLFSWGQDRVSVAVAAIVLGTMPAMVAVGEVVFLGHRLTAPHLTGIALALVGVAVISWGAGGPTTSTPAGLAVVTLATVVWAAVTVTGRELAP